MKHVWKFDKVDGEPAERCENCGLYLGPQVRSDSECSLALRMILYTDSNGVLDLEERGLPNEAAGRGKSKSLGRRVQ